MIEGNAPYLLLSDGSKLKNLNQLLGFEMPKQDGRAGSESINTSQTKALIYPLGMTFNDIKALVAVDGQSHLLPSTIQGKDDDGDEYMPSGTITATWRDYKNNVITDLTQPLLAYAAPYTLTITINNLKAQTKYGIPNSTHYGSLSKKYIFTSDLGIQYIKPLRMDVNKNFKEGFNIKHGQGFNPKVWDDGQGFSVKKMKIEGTIFPTTGFHNAVFDLIGSGNDQSKYRCSKKGSWVDLSGSASKNLGANCRVTYNHNSTHGKPTTPVTIDMEYKKTDGTWIKIDSYPITVPSKWAIGLEMLTYGDGYFLATSNNFPTLDGCRKVGPRADNGKTSRPQATEFTNEAKTFRQQYLYRRNEITNSPFADPVKYPENQVLGFNVTSVFSRDVDGTFMGEWGSIADYGGSAWSSWRRCFWTAEAYSNQGMYDVCEYGYFDYDGLPFYNVVKAVCRGE